jgi:hypothetical protein
MEQIFNNSTFEEDCIRVCRSINYENSKFTVIYYDDFNQYYATLIPACNMEYTWSMSYDDRLNSVLDPITKCRPTIIIKIHRSDISDRKLKKLNKHKELMVKIVKPNKSNVNNLIISFIDKEKLKNEGCRPSIGFNYLENNAENIDVKYFQFVCNDTIRKDNNTHYIWFFQ